MDDNKIKNQQETKRVNPLYNEFGTPHETAPFGKITLEDFRDGFIEGIRRSREKIDEIVNSNETPTFENIIVGVEEDDEQRHYYGLLGRTSNIFFNLLSAETTDEMEQLAQEVSPMLTQFSNDVTLNPRLFEKVKYIYEHHGELTPEEQMLLDKCYEGFVRNGALLDDEGKAKLRQLTEEASLLGLQFSQNLLKENKAFTLNITDEADLDGLPQTAIEAALAAARERGEDGWTITLDTPSYSPFMTYSTRRELRKQLYMARNTECCHDNDCNNMSICARLVNIRREIAQLLGNDCYADHVLKRRMAGNTDNIYKLLNQLIDAYKPTALHEREQVIALAKELEGDDFDYQPWDAAFYSHKLQLKLYNLDSEMLRPYFKLENVIQGVFGLATRLYGITFRENSEIPVYHPDVKAFEVFDEDGSFLAVFYADFHPRKGKRGGAWMTSYKDQYIDRDGVNHRPHVSVVMNLTKPTDDKPALLTLGEVETFLHEFGHSLHGMFANTRFESLSGTNVWWDFVELPSQFMENYAVERDFLRTFAFHYETGDPIPDELIHRIIESRNFMAASGCLRQVSLGLLDMAYYTMKEPFKADIREFEKNAWKAAVIGPQMKETCMTVQFSHIMAGGYSAGYYSYKWAEVLDADAFSLFKERGIFDRETARSFRENILSKGGTEHPMTLYKRFRGKEPTIDALLRRTGL